MKKHLGFSSVYILLIVLTLSVIGTAGYYVVNRQKTNDSGSTGDLNSDSTKENVETSNELENDDLSQKWKTIDSLGVTISYPEIWDNTDIPTGKLIVEGFYQDNTVIISDSFPLGFKYNNSEWEYVSTSEDYPIDSEDKQPEVASSNVSGAETTAIVESWENGCTTKKIVFVVNNKVYGVRLPVSCSAQSDYAGISSDSINSELDLVIKSIKIN